MNIIIDFSVSFNESYLKGLNQLIYDGSIIFRVDGNFPPTLF